MRRITLSDPTLRDGNHAVGHALTRDQVARYAALADAAGVPVVEVGHGNGLGASSFQVGFSRESDRVLLEAARGALRTARLGVHAIPGFATIARDLRPALELGVDVVRVASHCTEADITRRHLEFVRTAGARAVGVLMMSHMADAAVLVREAAKMEQYGAQEVVIMDSAGAYLPDDVAGRVGALVGAVGVEVGFHGHNNLGMAVANSLAAVRAGATVVDGTIRGFGAGAGNTQLELVACVLEKAGYATGVDLHALLDASDRAAEFLVDTVPTPTATLIASGMAGVFSGFLHHVERAAARYGVDAREIFFRLGERGLVAGQEDLIVEVALELSRSGPQPPRVPRGAPPAPLHRDALVP